MRRKARKRQPGQTGGVIVSPRTRIAPDMDLIWYHNEVGAGWRSRRAEVRTQRGERLVAHIDVRGSGYSIFTCGLSEGERRALKAGLAAFDFEEEDE